MSMARFVKVALGGSLALALMATACVENPDWQGTGSTTSSTATDAGSDNGRYAATIRRTEGQVAHITADNLANLSFGQGWASGEDRTCDLADQVLKVNGERAKWLGPGEDDTNIDSDFGWRSIGIRDIAAKDWKTTKPEVRELFDAYTAGWNSQLEKNGVDNIKDWCAGADWVRELEPVEVYAYARSIALLASSGRLVDMIGTAQPPGAEPAASTTEPTGETALGAPASEPAPLASNGWAIGKDRSTDGGGLLMANPHFPWEGELRFWEVHLTVPGQVDMYGVQLSGVPGIAIGFNENFGWTHTVSAGNRFTAYKLNLVNGSPTTYMYGDEQREMTPTKLSIEVLGDDGKVSGESRTTWRSHYGPILDFPGFGWSDTATISIRDANINNDEFIIQYLELLKAKTLDDLKDLNKKYTGVPLFNTIAVSKDGRAWYADTSATPNLSEEAQLAYTESVSTDPIAKIAKENGAVLLDGSDPMFEWQNVEGARDPGLVPYSEMPMTERSDYVFNANDSFWMPNAKTMIEGDYSILHGYQRTPRSPRTRENATVLDDVSKDGPSGSDGKFSLKELADASLQNRGYTSRALLDDVVQRCKGSSPVSVEALPADDDIPGLPAATVDIAKACEVLADWDGVYDLDRSGPPVWRELMAGYKSDDLLSEGPLWAKPFDADNPVKTPSGLAVAAPGQADPVLVNLARAVQTLELAEKDPGVKLGEIQVSNRNGTEVPIHGGNGADGTTNVVTWSRGWDTLDPSLLKLEADKVDAGSAMLNRTGADAPDLTGYPINYGTSFLMALEFTDGGPKAKTFLTYGNVADRTDPSYLAVTEWFSKKKWKTARYTEDQVADGTTDETVVTD